jgi:hypothetical protein
LLGRWLPDLEIAGVLSVSDPQLTSVAAGLAAVGTVLEELRPGEKKRGGRAKAHDEEAQ